MTKKGIYLAQYILHITFISALVLYFFLFAFDVSLARTRENAAEYLFNGGCDGRHGNGYAAMRPHDALSSHASNASSIQKSITQFQSLLDR